MAEHAFHDEIFDFQRLTVTRLTLRWNKKEKKK